MNSTKSFSNIRKICDSILLKNLNEITISNNSLNVIKGHPFHLKLYNEKKTKKFFNVLIYIFKNLVYLFFSTIKNYSSKKLSKRKVDVLLISNLVNINDINKEDFIFSDLEKKFKNSKIKFHKIFINHTNFSKKKILNKIKKKKNISILEFYYTNYKSSYLIFYNQIKYFYLFILLAFRERNNKERKNMLLFIASEFLNLNTKKNLNLFENYKNFIKNLSFNKLLIPYEGYSWERLILKASKDKINNLKCYGYHFSALSKFQHSIFRKVNSVYEPDLIYTTGRFSKNEFEKKINKKIKILGSNRFYKKKIKLNKNNRIQRCLVLPEGILSECLKIFSFSILAAKSHTKMRFIWRLHPTMNFKEILSKMKIASKKDLPKNIYLSEDSFFKDIVSANFCLYRGSTASITSLQNGILPIYLNDKNTSNIDPLYKLKKWKQVINNLNDFNKIINNKKNKKKDLQDKKFAINFSLKYFEKLNTDKLIKDFKIK